MADIFISYAVEDRDIVSQIVPGLEDAGYSTWDFQRDSLPAVPYVQQIPAAIDRARAVVVIVSSSSLESPHVSAEVVAAFRSGKHIVPLLRGLSHEEFRLQKHDWDHMLGAAVFISLPTANLSTAVVRIIAGLHELNVLPSGPPFVSRWQPTGGSKPERVEVRVVSGLEKTPTPFDVGLPIIGQDVLAPIEVEAPLARAPVDGQSDRPRWRQRGKTRAVAALGVLGTIVFIGFFYRALVEDNDSTTPTPASEVALAVTPLATQMPAASTPGVGMASYLDDFNNPGVGVLTRNSYSRMYEYGYEDGEYFIRTDDPFHMEPVAVFLPDLNSASDGVVDVAISVDVRFEGSENDDNALLGCRALDGVTTGYRLWVEHADQLIGLERWDRGRIRYLLPAEGTAVPEIRAHATNRLELICIGNTIIVRINSVEVAQINDQARPIAGGRAWIGTDHWDEVNIAGTPVQAGTTEARFDNLTMTIPDASVVESTPNAVR